VVLGHRRLAIRDLSSAGRQPMLDVSGEVCVTYNGEIYNYEPLRRQIEREAGYRFRSTCDTEILPIGWRLWGEGLFERIEGMFAVALWDRARQQLVLARDGVGIKPLYIAHVGNVLWFASEIKGVLASMRVPVRIDTAALHTYMAAGYPERDSTLLQQVRQLAPGTVQRWSASGCVDRRYWQPRRDPVIRNSCEAADAVKACLLEVTSEMTISDVPIGLLLSGGIDSALLALTLGNKMPCYTACFEERSHDEAAAARAIASVAGSPWKAVPVGNSSGTVEDFVAAALSVDGQLADSSCLAHYALCRAVRREVKVALAGDGADEFFGGYPTYLASRAASILAPVVPRLLARRASSWLARSVSIDESRLPWREVAARFLAGLAYALKGHHAEWRRITPASSLPALYGPAMRYLLETDPLREYRDAATADGNVLDRSLLADQLFYLPADMLVKVDRSSMAHGLEIRVPFLDRRLMDLARTLHGSLLAPLLGRNKRVLRSVLGTLNAPPDSITGPKRGFNVPLARLLRNDLRAMGEELIERNVDVYEPWLAPDGLRRMWREHIQGLANHAYPLWAVLVFGIWRRTL
jgi:asparagine synthase (glutamine-hydrolysing)